jgi:hypothetical protein
VIEGQPRTLRSLNKYLLAAVHCRIRFGGDVREKWAKPWVACRCGIRGEVNVLGSKSTARDCRTYAAQGGTESFGHGQAMFLLSVLRGDDHGVAVHTDAVGSKSKSLEFRAQHVEVDQTPGRDQQARLRSNETGWQLAQQNHLSVRLLERVAGVGATASDAEVDLFLYGDNRGDLAFAFRTELSTHHHPDAH